MTSFTDKINIVNLDGLTDFERIDTNLRTLIASVAGTIPGSRGFGLSLIVDRLPKEAGNELFAQLDAQIERYIPEIQIEDLELNIGTDGKMEPKIYIQEADKRVGA